MLNARAEPRRHVIIGADGSTAFGGNPHSGFRQNLFCKYRLVCGPCLGVGSSLQGADKTDEHY